MVDSANSRSGQRASLSLTSGLILAGGLFLVWQGDTQAASLVLAFGLLRLAFSVWLTTQLAFFARLGAPVFSATPATLATPAARMSWLMILLAAVLAAVGIARGWSPTEAVLLGLAVLALSPELWFLVAELRRWAGWAGWAGILQTGVLHIGTLQTGVLQTGVAFGRTKSWCDLAQASVLIVDSALLHEAGTGGAGNLGRRHALPGHR